ncbi:AraC family transcriptional regulator [Herbaspirillum sp. HC18]|nr:AraC family transcriptional regulator [Herbaspirillum sp. HC18]
MHRLAWKIPSMLLVQKTLFDSALLNIRHAVARPSSSPCSEIMHGLADVLLLPIAGTFAKHDSPRQHVIANANHGLFFGFGKPYRISFPDDRGDESLVLRFSDDALAGLLAETVGIEDLCSPSLNTHCLLPPSSVLERDLLWHFLAQGATPPLLIEEICVSMLAASLLAASRNSRAGEHARRASTLSRRRRQVESVKEAISLYPAQDWTLDALARLANTTPYHLARIFREEVGVPVYQYLVRTRLGLGLERMRVPGTSLTDIALEAGFSTHSHFSSSFRAVFGTSPSQFRNRANRH